VRFQQRLEVNQQLHADLLVQASQLSSSVGLIVDLPVFGLAYLS
jgi:hypothetical protein